MHHRPLPERARASAHARLPKDPASLALAAKAGDPAAQTELMRIYDRRLRRVARGFGLSPSDVDDVLQSTWLCALTGLHALRRPDAIGAWLSVAARREALRRLQQRVGEVLVDEPPDVESAEPSFADLIAVDNEHTVLRKAIGSLAGRQRQLLLALLDHPGASYAEIGATLGMPLGAIGPTRDRAIARLREDPRIVALRAGDQSHTRALVA